VETVLAEDRVALNLLYTQAIWEVERGWVLASKEVRNKLSSLQSRGEKREVRNSNIFSPYRACWVSLTFIKIALIHFKCRWI